MTHYRCTENGRVRLKPQTACGCYCMTVWPYCEMSAGTDVRAGGNFLQYLTLQMVLTVGCCWFRIAEMGAQVCYGVYLWQYIRLAHLTASLPEKTKKWDRLLNSREEVLTDRLHCIRFMKKKTANMEVIAENTLRNSYEKRLKKISNSIRFYMLFGSVAMTNCCMCRGECTRKHQNHPERQNDYASNQETAISR